MKLAVKANPRTKDGGFEEEWIQCCICNQQSTALAEINVVFPPLFLCKSCLNNAEELINKEILNQYKR